MILLVTVSSIEIKNRKFIHEIQLSAISETNDFNYSSDLLMNKLNSPFLSESDKLFISGYVNFIDGNDELATDYFKDVTTKDNQINSAYSYKVLSHLNHSVDDKKSLGYAKNAFELIPKSQYGKNYDLIESIVQCILLDHEKKSLAVSILEQVVSDSNPMSDEQRLKYLKLLGNVHYHNQDYTQVIETNLKIISLSDWINDSYSQGMALLRIATVTHQIGAYESAMDLLESIESSEIKDSELRNNLEINQLISLALLKHYVGEVDESIELIFKLDDYKNQLSDKEVEIMNFYQTVLLAFSYIEQQEIENAQIQLQVLANYLNKDYSSYFINTKTIYYFINGLFHKQTQNYEEAVKNFELILPYVDKRPNLFNQILYYEHLTDAYQLANEVEKEAKYNQELILLRQKQTNFILEEYLQYMSYRFDYDRLINERLFLTVINLLVSILLIIITIIFGEKFIHPKIKVSSTRREIRNYLENENYFIVYQPIVNPKTDEVMGAEALLRLQVDNQLIMPDKSIEQIESCHMMGEVTAWILKKVLDDYETLAASKKSKSFYISINLTFREIENDDFCQTIAKALMESNVPKQAICLEITESVRGNNDTKVRENISYLKDVGFKIALDDFGMEYSNFFLLDKFDFNLIKLDKYFIDHIGESSNKALIGVIYYLSQTKDVTIVVEGVENELQQSVIKRIPLNQIYIQGYFYSKPLELSEFQQFIKSRYENS